MQKMATEPLNPLQKQALDAALNIAIGAQDLDMMANAVVSGANPNILLFKGIQNREIDWVKTAVDHGADLTSSMSGISSGEALKSYQPYPVFFWLTRYFDAAIGDYLLSKGADIDAISQAGDTALMAAVQLKDTTAINYLAKSGADPLKICADKKIPMKELEDDTSWFKSADKVPLIKTMLETLTKKNTGVTPAANDPGAAQTQESIEISRPIELKRKPQNTFEL